METVEYPNKRYMAKFERFEPVIRDHTAIITAKKCFRMYFYQIVLGRRLREDFVVFAWGSSYHKFREVLSLEYGIGEQTPKKFDEDKAKEAFVKAAQVGLDYWTKNGKDQPVDSKWEFMTSSRLLQSFKVAYEHWMHERKQGKIIVIAVEQAFNVRLKDGRYTSGRVDELLRWQGRIWGRDFKTSAKDENYFKRSITPNDQFSRYTVAEGLLCGEPIQGQVIEQLWNAKSTKTQVKGPKIFTHLATRTKSELEEWEDGNSAIEDFLDVCRERDIWPQCEVNCNWCPYHIVCKAANESAKMNILENMYQVIPWDNTKIHQGTED